jgi:hypothetical protein
MVTKCKAIELRTPFEPLETTPTTFLHVMSLNKIHVEWHNEINMVVNIKKKEIKRRFINLN